MISILLPSRGRPENVARLAESALETATYPADVELVVIVDMDDPKLDGYYEDPAVTGKVRLHPTRRKVLSDYWNYACRLARGPIFMQCGDDIVFRTEGWDGIVSAAFADFPDRIVFVHGDDGDPTHDRFGTHGFLHQRWVETLGYFTPDCFSSDYGDTWINDLADRIGRSVRVPILTEHMHFAYHKGTLDRTHAERILRHFDDDVDALYVSKEAEREQDAEKLRKVMQ